MNPLTDSLAAFQGSRIGLELGHPVRVLLLELPQLLRGILEHEVRSHEACEVVAAAGRPELALDAQTAVPDVVVLGLAAGEDVTLVPALLARWPMAHVMTVMNSGEGVSLYELRPRFHELGEMSPAGIVDAFVEAVHRSRAG